jgi:hypothetical protein
MAASNRTSKEEEAHRAYWAAKAEGDELGMQRAMWAYAAESKRAHLRKKLWIAVAAVISIAIAYGVPVALYWR